ncbi:hypothetical protein [Gordonia sp. (in: high G+C Gram-positive bacteria)]|uniref:hypothetical protein n=1 Tax=Gordonia sp. (in: high G+C Gram-positive bacteria) TaxID=84139 RepID=UPI00261C77E7|nr:hypothetical protein [Gordonia sp. (in: high G+C Gram-positive bacteria)]
MIEPQGPLPPEVYWRRRLLAIAVGVVAIAVVVGLIVWAGSGGSGDNKAANTAATSSATGTTPVAPAPAGDSSAAPKPGDGQQPESTPVAPPSSSDPAAGAQTPPTDGQGTVPCSDQAISVVLYTDKPTYTKGDQPVFTIVVTNAGLAACSRDVGKASQNVVVRSLDGTRTLWTAQDCAPDKTVNEQVLAPGQQVTDTLTWSGTTSNPGCNKPRVAIPVGAYQAIAKIGAKESAPITFNVVAPAQQ